VSGFKKRRADFPVSALMAARLSAFWAGAGEPRWMPDSKVEEYRRLAEQCLRLAQSEDLADRRAFFLEMAGAWYRLAREHEAQPEMAATKC
jgi:hypothetical protein